MGWNHRVIRTQHKDEMSYSVHEVYYADDGEAEGWTVEPVSPTGETLEELRKDIDLFQRALDKPVLEVQGDEGAEKLVVVQG